MSRRLIISCTPRSGSTWLADRLQECGLDVGHEREGRDGIVSYMAHLDMATQSDKLQDTSGLRVHLIRDPAECIASMVARSIPSQSTVDFVAPGRVTNAADFWIRWNSWIHGWASVTVTFDRLLYRHSGEWAKIGLPDHEFPFTAVEERRNASRPMNEARELYEEWT